MPKGRCDKHAAKHQQDYDRARGTRTERLYDAKWYRARNTYLMLHPLCVHCLAQDPPLYSEATEVDHKTPHEGDRDLFWDESNWQGLCKSCHSRKTLGETRAGQQRQVK